MAPPITGVPIILNRLILVALMLEGLVDLPPCQDHSMARGTR